MPAFKDLNIQNADSVVKEFEYNGMKFNVKDSLSARDLIDFVDITLQKSYEDGVYNLTKVWMYMRLNMIYLFTDITFDEEDRTDEEELFDKLNKSEIIDKVYEMNKYYMDGVRDIIYSQIEMNLKYKHSMAGVLNTAINSLPHNAEIAKNIIDNFDKEKFKSVIDFAQAANGNRPIK